MNEFESIINNTTNLNRKNKTIVFSVLDHKLSRKEARDSIMFYSQAIKENKLELAEHFESIYNISFSLLYAEYKKNIFFYTVYDNLDLLNNLNFEYLKEYSDGIDTIYKSDSKEDFLKFIKLNLEEEMPFHNIVFDDCNIFIQFNFDLTILVTFTEKDICRVDRIKEILIYGGFHEL